MRLRNNMTFLVYWNHYYKTLIKTRLKVNTACFLNHNAQPYIREDDNVFESPVEKCKILFFSEPANISPLFDTPFLILFLVIQLSCFIWEFFSAFVLSMF
jgi:hypothetical protein